MSDPALEKIFQKEEACDTVLEDSVATMRQVAYTLKSLAEGFGRTFQMELADVLYKQFNELMEASEAVHDARLELTSTRLQLAQVNTGNVFRAVMAGIDVAKREVAK